MGIIIPPSFDLLDQGSVGIKSEMVVVEEWPGLGAVAGGLGGGQPGIIVGKVIPVDSCSTGIPGGADNG